MNTLKSHRTMITLLSLIAFSSLAWASPKTIHFQGRLTDNSGAPIKGSDVHVKFSIFQGPNDTSPVWDSTGEQAVATNEAGLFATDIGPVNPDIFSQYPDLYLQISVRDTGGLKPLLPRQHLTTVPFAIQADFATNAGLANDIKDNTISTLKIQSQAVTANHLAPDAVHNSNLADRNVTAMKIATNTITFNEINRRTIQEINLATDAVRSSNILDRSIEASKISSRTITATEIMPDSITSTEIQDHTIKAIDLDYNAIQLATGTVGPSQLQPGSVGNLQLSTDAVDTWNIKDRRIQEVDLATDAVRSSNILDGSIDGSKISTGAIATYHIQMGAIKSNQIDMGAVKAIHIATGEVTSDAIADSTIREVDIGDEAVTDRKIKGVSADKIIGPVKNSQIESVDIQKITNITGIVVPFAGITPPTGWLLCDGTEVSRTIYAALFNVIGTSYGQGDGSSTFTIPDLRGRFIRGVDGSAGRDPDHSTRARMAAGGNSGNSVGSIQGEEVQSHTHPIDDPGHDHSLLANQSAGVVAVTIGGPNQHVSGGGQDGGSFAITATGPSPSKIKVSGSGGTETRPINAYLNFIIKY